jgi:hypothetical protein
MKRFGVVVIALAFASALRGGIVYRFASINEGAMAHTFSGVAKIEGSKSRVDVISGDEKMFPSGSVILSSGDTRVLTVLNPAKKTYYQIDFNSSMTSAQKEFSEFVKMPPPTINVKKEGSGGLIEGYPTQRYTVNSSIEMRFNAPGYKAANRIDMTSEIWTTDKLPADAARQIQTPIQTGLEGLDQLIEAAHSRVSGFPLKEVTTQRVTMNGSTTTTKRRSNVTGIRQMTFGPAEFGIPAGYTRVDSPIDAMLRAVGH